MLIPFPLPRLALLFCALFALAACAPNPTSTLGGADPYSPLPSPLPTPHPTLAVYETPILRDPKDMPLADVVRVQFDIDEWSFVQSHVFNYVLTNTAIPTCYILQPTGDPGKPHTPVSRTTQLGNREWTVHPDTWSVDQQIWRLRYRSAPYEFTIMMLNYVEPVTDISGRACIAAAESVLTTFAIAPAANQPLTEDATAKPRVWLKQKEDGSGEPIVPDVEDVVAQSANWIRYASDRAGFSVALPPGWSVTDDEIPAVFLTPPSGDGSQRIWLSWLPVEKPLGRPLREWLEAGEGDEMFPRFEVAVDDPMPIVDPSGTSEQARLEFGAPFTGDAYDISHGNLVLHVNSYSAMVDAPAILRAVASSIQFAEDAPTTLADIPWR